jgi:hypothetical protein
VDPGYGQGGLRPTHPIKPGGFPIIPVDPDWSVPEGNPSLPGNWIPIEPGHALPPVWGFLPVDPGFGVGEGRPDNSLPGHWVPVDPGYSIPLPGCPPCNCEGLKPGQLPVWVWIPEIGPDFGLKPQPK